ncbi:hypothetical protein [Largemouth bass virus]|uniref:Uncharacterized protein n=1 Tax=Largemouth bass virus TaxID=176656 RepID=A0A9E7PPB8_9VIRU|nr:hypothetical protein [Mandarin fish ranavirus]UUY86202.1 hypothetical protein [Largemouth bass virus]WEI29038.1 hypothetical protein [Largemouth bass virus]WHA35501.1 hypothetical protein MSRaV_13R [Micropterus salmoides ranavirus]WHA35606.1 hypothetical protein SCRaV_13R [Siniperca chuatsi ranavirus]
MDPTEWASRQVCAYHSGIVLRQDDITPLRDLVFKNLSGHARNRMLIVSGDLAKTGKCEDAEVMDVDRIGLHKWETGRGKPPFPAYTFVWFEYVAADFIVDPHVATVMYRMNTRIWMAVQRNSITIASVKKGPLHFNSCVPVIYSSRWCHRVVEYKQSREERYIAALYMATFCESTKASLRPEEVAGCPDVAYALSFMLGSQCVRKMLTLESVSDFLDPSLKKAWDSGMAEAITRVMRGADALNHNQFMQEQSPSCMSLQLSREIEGKSLDSFCLVTRTATLKQIVANCVPKGAKVYTCKQALRVKKLPPVIYVPMGSLHNCGTDGLKLFERACQESVSVVELSPSEQSLYVMTGPFRIYTRSHNKLIYRFIKNL